MEKRPYQDNQPMLAIPGYQILVKIYESSHSLVYRGIRESDNLSVILKFLKEDYPDPAEITRYKQEYEITHSLNIEGVIKSHILVKYENTLAIIFEDFGGYSLKFWMKQRRFTINDFLKIAIEVTKILGKIHAAKIVHKDINPSNIVFNPEMGKVKIIDFGISTVLTRENPAIKNPAVLEGTLAYLSPEQTGRMNRSLDYRTDFYSLGATFYELLTHRLPFEATDAMELVHCHIAKVPVPPSEGVDEIPRAISDIVMKLMAKTAEDRYQSAWGIQADLEECLTQLETLGNISDFPLARQDISEKFQIPQKLYGRQKNVETLIAAFERVSGRQKAENSKQNEENFSSEMMLILGYSGIGKSSLVQEIYKPLTGRQGYFIAGKFDQFLRNIPYSAVAIAFSDWVQQILTEPEAQLEQWRNQLLAALGVNLRVIIDVIPELELIVGKQQSELALSPEESQNRLRLAFQNFIRAIASPENPASGGGTSATLVIFLDDLQWADVASLKLIQLLMTASDSQGLFFIGAYRDNEVDAAHPLMLTIDEIQKAGAIVNRIVLSALELPDVNQLISETLNSPPEKTLLLAELVLSKTRGNPFFMNEFLKSLYEEKLLEFNFTFSNTAEMPEGKRVQSGGWKWDLEQIKARSITDNVVELMALKIQKLPEQAQQVLTLCACIGNQFDLSALAIVFGKSPGETAAYLREAIAEGFIQPLGDAYKITGDWDNFPNPPSAIAYKFAHDRIQQAAYSLIPDSQKQAVHLQIGQQLLLNTPEQSRELEIFDIVNHLNFGIELINREEERSELAKLNLIAGNKALISAAHEQALNYLKIALKLLNNSGWQSQYNLTRDLYVEASKAAYLSGDFEEMEKLTQVVLQRAATLLDKAKVFEVIIQARIAQNKPLEAVYSALEVLKLLGFNLPEKPRQWYILFSLLRTKIVLAWKRIEDLINLPPMSDPYKKAAMRILALVVPPAYNAFPQLLPLIVLNQVNLSVQYGNAESSVLAYSAYGLILCGIVGDIDSGYQFGQLALSLSERINARDIKARSAQMVNTLIIHWKKPIRETLQPLLDAYSIALETGDFEGAALALHIYSYHSYFVGQELTGLQREIVAYNRAIAQLKQETFLNYNKIFHQAILNLITGSENPGSLMGESYNESESLLLHLEKNDRTAICDVYFNKLILSYLFEEYDRAVEFSASTEKYLDGVPATAIVPIFYFYDSLARLAIYSSVQQSEQKRILQKVSANQQKMKKWSDRAPINCLHKYYLVEAEKHRILGRNASAIDLYDRAIESAKESEYIHEEALAYERTAKFYLAKGKTKIARAYMQDARYSYLKWGAIRKVRDLEARYPQLMASKPADRSVLETIHPNTSSFPTPTGSGQALDLTTVIKASQAISGEIVLGKLLAKLMKILIENAGAQKGYLILKSQDKLLIEASGSVDSDSLRDSGASRVDVLQSIPINCSSQEVSEAIVNYVVRTQESVVLNEAAKQGKFVNDPYIIQNKPKSILCTPLLNQGHLTGVLYLENNLTTHAFPGDRLEVLQLLSAQAAISIANARLYSNLQEALDAELELTDAYGRFVPHEFLYFLGYESIVEAKLGDYIQQEMSVLFADIRDFTSLSESMTPEDTFKFLNAYLSRMEPAITENHGFIDKYIGDAIMALFSGSADDAVRAGIAMLHRLNQYNENRIQNGYVPIKIGIGINTGCLMLGTVGGHNRMDGTVISDAVNLASRIESLTKDYKVSMLITHQTFSQLQDPGQYAIRIIDKVKVKGKSQTVSVFEVFDGDPPESREGKLATGRIFLQALLCYNQQEFKQAQKLFQECLDQNPRDTVVQIYLNRCQQQIG